jgi:RNA polymerase sigma-70 factor, ECF subfamily
MNVFAPPSDEQLIAQVMAGERAALTPLVERHHRPLLGYPYRILGGDRALAEDLGQETFVRVLQQESYQRNSPFKPWLYAIATNLAHDYFRSGSARRMTLPGDDLFNGLAAPAPTPEEQFLAAEQGSAVQFALGQISAEYRAALILRLYNGLSLQEIAETLRIPLGTVKSRLSVGIHRLRELLTEANREVIP